MAPIQHGLCNMPEDGNSFKEASEIMSYRGIISQANGVKVSKEISLACHWYETFLKLKVHQNWPLVFHTLKSLDMDVASPQNMPVVYRFLDLVATYLQETHVVTLLDIWTLAAQNQLLKFDEEQGINFDTSVEFIFEAIRWLTMLYASRRNFKLGEQDSPSFEANYYIQHLESYHVKSNNSISFDQYLYLRKPMSDLVSRLTNLEDISSGPLVGVSPSSTFKSLQGLNYYTLRTNNQIEIEWVDAIGLHLDFDPNRRILKLFRYPSFSILMLYHTKDTAIGRLLDDHLSEARSRMSSLPSSSADRDLSDDLLCEILLTYRLLFAQDKRSKRLFFSEISKLTKGKSESESDVDPFLRILCGGSGRKSLAKSIYDSIKIFKKKDFCYLIEDFFFFRKKLVFVQDYVKEEAQWNGAALWKDRRAVGKWWTFWIILFLSANSIILSILMVLFQIWNLTNARSEFDSGVIGDFAPFIKITVISTCLFLFYYVIRRNYHLWVPQIQKVLNNIRAECKELGHMRSVNWRCGCGKTIHDTFAEVAPNAVSLLEKDLNRRFPISSRKQTQSITDEERQVQDTTWISRTGTRFRTLCSLIGVVADESFELIAVDIPAEEANSIRSSSGAVEPLYLLVCLMGNKGSTELLQLNVSHMISDKELFAKLRSEYYATRGKWLQFLSLHCLREIRFVHFELWASGEVEVQNHCDNRMLPPRYRGEEYCYELGPRGVLPPIGSEHLVHLFHNPNHPDCEFLKCWQRFPKKRGERLHVDSTGAAEGWGIHFVEGWNLILIWVLMFVIVASGSLAFGVAYSVLERDIQSAFAISSYVVSLLTLIIMGCSMCAGWLGKYFGAAI